MIGKTISHYKILEKLGEGGMGEVYLAEDMNLGRKVAVKFLSSDKSTDPESRQRFVHEARAQAMLSHPNIATFYEVGEEGDKVFIVMEYIEGQSLSKMALAEKLSLPEILHLAIQVGEGLQAAHERGVVHRDIKPENVLVTSKHHAKITDFGLAKWKGASTLTKTGARMGTAFYMSPEQVEGKKVDHRTDIFSLGAVLYELLCARRPFEGETDTAIFYDLINTQPQPLARFARNIPEKLEQIVLKCLAKRPEERYQSAADLVTDLRSLKKELDSFPGEKSQQKQAPQKKNRTFLYAGIAVLTILLISAALFLWQNGKNGRTGGSGGAQKFTKLAILPFRPLRNDAETEFLGFSLADQIITKLGYVQSVVVRPSSAVEKYTAANLDLPQVARELDVGVILIASYLKEGRHLRLNAQLVQVPKNEIIWQLPLDIQYADIFSVQDTISKRIINGLKLRLSNVEADRLQKDVSTNPLAYEYYLKAIAIQAITAADHNVKIQLLQKSVELDSSYAPAWAELGNQYRLYAGAAGNRGGYYELSEKALLKALQINSELPFALSQLAHYYIEIGKAEEAAVLLQKAIGVNPRIATLYGALGYLYRYAGMLDLSIAAYERSQTLDSSLVNLAPAQNQITKPFFHKGDYSAAVASAEKVVRYRQMLDQAPTLPELFYLGMVRYYSRDSSKAFRAFDSCWSIEKNNTWSLFGQAYKAGAQKDKKRLLGLIKKLEEREIVDAEMYYRLAHFYCLADQPEKALKSLRTSTSGGFFSYPYISTDPLLEKIRGTAEFQLVLKDVKKRHETFKQRFGEKFW